MTNKWEALRDLEVHCLVRKELEGEAEEAARKARDEVLAPYRQQMAKLMQDAVNAGVSKREIGRLYGSSHPRLVDEYLQMLG